MAEVLLSEAEKAFILHGVQVGNIYHQAEILLKLYLYI